MNILDELLWRGLMADCTDQPALLERMAKGPVTLYAGFDPTADSLHVGHLVPLLALRRFQDAGHIPIALAGGATGSIGDPSGKSAERNLLTKDLLKGNVEAIRPQLARFLDFNAATNPAQLVDNADWTAPVSYLDFLRDIGKHFTVNQMVAKESVRSRMEDREVGISYTEFSYMLLQAFDFAHLCEHHDCELQIGGSDQWGNITAGMDLIRKKLGRHAFGLTLPLITKADGTKFGKTEGGAIWLDPNRTSVYKFYQFWINTDDRDVVKYLKFFTFLSHDTIAELEKEHTENPGSRIAHKALARAVTELIHGAAAEKQAEIASLILFGGVLEGISEHTINELLQTDDFNENQFIGQKALLDKASGELPQVMIEGQRFSGLGAPLVELLVHAGLCNSKGQARKDIEGGGIYINNIREADFQKMINENELLFGKHLLLRKGKKNYVMLTAKQ